MTDPKITPAIYDRIHLSCPGRSLAIEYIDGFDGLDEIHLDEWRLIDLDTGEVFAKDSVPHEVLHVASAMTRVEGSPKPTYVREARKHSLFKDIPLADKLRHIESHAKDLEHDFNLVGDVRCPLDAAIQMYNTMYNHRCWYQEEDGRWEIDLDVC